jgi:hypothetical protein
MITSIGSAVNSAAAATWLSGGVGVDGDRLGGTVGAAQKAGNEATAGSSVLPTCAVTAVSSSLRAVLCNEAGIRHQGAAQSRRGDSNPEPTAYKMVHRQQKGACGALRW